MSDVDFLTGRPRSGPLEPYYGAIALAPDRQYGIDPGPGNDRGFAFNQWLPFTTNRVGSGSWVVEGANPSWSLPQIVREGLKGWLDLAQAKDTGTLTPEALGAFTTGALGAGMAGAPAGALTSGGRGFVLPTDTASRLKRAAEMGFKTDLPLYHGTNSGTDFPAFRALPPWQATREGRSPGVSLAEAPAVASRFAEPRVRHLLGLSPTSRAQELQEGLPRVYPLFIRSEKSGSLELNPGDDWGDIWRAVAGAFGDGYDAVRLRNYTMFPGLGPQNNWMIRDSNQLRSWFARFDPAKRDSDDLLAARATPGFSVAPPPQAGVRFDPALVPNELRRLQDRVY